MNYYPACVISDVDINRYDTVALPQTRRGRHVGGAMTIDREDIEAIAEILSRTKKFGIRYLDTAHEILKALEDRGYHKHDTEHLVLRVVDPDGGTLAQPSPLTVYPTVATGDSGDWAGA